MHESGTAAEDRPTARRMPHAGKRDFAGPAVLLLAPLCLVHSGRQERQTLFMALIGSAVTPGKLGYHRAKGAGVAPCRVTPVEPDASIGARPVRRRLIDVIPSSRPAASLVRKTGRRGGVISIFYPIANLFSVSAGDRGTPRRTFLRGRCGSKRVGTIAFVANPVEGVRADRGESRYARSTSLAWGVLGLATGGTGLQPKPASGSNAPGGEKLNHERGESPCQ